MNNCKPIKVIRAFIQAAAAAAAAAAADSTT
jgi:hypothetical protein